MPIDFDSLVPRRGTDSHKWELYDEDVLPMWVADMDFRSPEPVIKALHDRVEHGIFGYGMDEPQEMVEVVQERLLTHHNLRVEPEAISFVPGLGSALNITCRSVGQDDDDVLTLAPIYRPFLTAITNSKRKRLEVEMPAITDGSQVRYEIDSEALEAAITPRTHLFLLCNPHNPVGRMWTRAELERIADIALRHNLTICADEIHCDLHYGGDHTSIASLSPEVAARTITLLAPSKTFNIPGLGCGYVVATNPELIAAFNAAREGIVPDVNVLGYVGAIAAYRYGQPWLEELLPYLRGNRDLVTQFVTENLPGVRVTHPEATYLSWLDFRDVPLPALPGDYFLDAAKVALIDGTIFGRGGDGFARLNFGCPRPLLQDALQRIQAAVERVGAV